MNISFVDKNGKELTIKEIIYTENRTKVIYDYENDNKNHVDYFDIYMNIIEIIDWYYNHYIE